MDFGLRLTSAPLPRLRSAQVGFAQGESLGTSRSVERFWILD
ncbi:hypothetical protein [Nostoc sp.]